MGDKNMSDWFIFTEANSGNQIDVAVGGKKPDKLYMHRYMMPVDRMLFRFVPYMGKWGYIEHKEGMIFQTDQLNPEIVKPMTIGQDRNEQFLFKIDEENGKIYHRTGLVLQKLQPGQNEGVLALGPDGESAGIWEFKDKNDNPIRVRSPVRDLSGSWEVIYAVLEPKAEQEDIIEYTVGNSQNLKVDAEIEVDTERQILIDILIEAFKKEYYFSEMVSATGSMMWKAKSTHKRTIKVKPGDNVVVWQWVCKATHENGEEFTFRSSILKDTADLRKPARPTW